MYLTDIHCNYLELGACREPFCFLLHFFGCSEKDRGEEDLQEHNEQ